eukprot:CAMPEP_0172417298 /NCGR_PEP_ID=MMETSP1064-20121228/3827_1 /TAXON_ID=202472 /ORGANISM="Aulacoseira subarctica , Strain CCAP 1002/5" /LENGTH=271 /DNA_ID=CAMNT_0013155549 /DNA_START=91 /DNA_END=903 /DNA_ORIENTATION=+
MREIKTLLLVLALLVAWSDGEKILFQASNSGSRQLKVKHSKVNNKPTYETTDGYHKQRRWIVFTYYTETSCETIVSCHGYPEGVCAQYTYDDKVWWMNYAGDSKTNIVLMWSFFNDNACSKPHSDSVPGFYGLTAPQGVESWSKECRLDDLKSFTATDQTPKFKHGVVFNTFSTLANCHANNMEATFSFVYDPYGQCGYLPGISSFLKDRASQSVSSKAVRIQRCTDDSVVYDVYDAEVCEGTFTTITFSRKETCKGGQNNGDVLGYINFQ